jgi:hypothetical protein
LKRVDRERESGELRGMFPSSLVGLFQRGLSYGGQTVRFATKMAGGSTRNGRDTIGKRLGIKQYGG